LIQKGEKEEAKKEFQKAQELDAGMIPPTKP
jgi:hypothetical protein